MIGGAEHRHVPIVDFARLYEPLRPRFLRAIESLLESGRYILGPEVAAFESDFAQWCGCKYGVGVASGTDAIYIALAAIGVGPGDEVITAPLAFAATPNAILRTGAEPVFVDVDSRTLCLDPKLAAARFTHRTRAILPVHLYGAPAAMGEIMELARRHGLFVVEDCAQAAGANIHGKPVGSFGNAGCFSFFPTKNLGGFGDGGMLVTNDPAIAERADMLRRQGARRKHYTEVLGINSRLDTLQAVLLQIGFEHLAEWNRRRRAAADVYDSLLKALPITLPEACDGEGHVYNLYTIRAADRDRLAVDLKAYGVETMVYYPIPLHRQPAFERWAPAEPLAVAEQACRQVLSLPMHPALEPREQEYVAAAIAQTVDQPMPVDP